VNYISSNDIKQDKKEKNKRWRIVLNNVSLKVLDAKFLTVCPEHKGLSRWECLRSCISG